MSVEQYQRSVDNLDREIASLEKKKAAIDKKAADEALKASKVTISKNASDSTRKTKLNEIDRHNNASIKASQESAKIQKQISEKRARRNSEYDKLKKEQAKAQKKEQAEHQRMINNLQQDYPLYPEQRKIYGRCTTAEKVYYGNASVQAGSKQRGKTSILH